MNFQTTAIFVAGILAVIATGYYAYRFFIPPVTVGTLFSKETFSCYRFKGKATSEFYFKVGMLASTSRVIGNADIRSVSARLKSGSTLVKSTFDVTKNSTGTKFYLNTTFTLSKSISGPDLPAHTTPGSGLTFTFTIELPGETITIDDVPIIPIDLDPC